MANFKMHTVPGASVRLTQWYYSRMLIALLTLPCRTLFYCRAFSKARPCGNGYYGEVTLGLEGLGRYQSTVAWKSTRSTSILA